MNVADVTEIISAFFGCLIAYRFVCGMLGLGSSIEVHVNVERIEVEQV